MYLWSRNRKHAVELQASYSSRVKHLEVLSDLNDDRLRQSDVICTCTASEQPLIGLAQVKKGVHINGKRRRRRGGDDRKTGVRLAVGSFRETMRELADDLMLSADTSVIVDSRESAMKEAGEIIQSKVRSLPPVPLLLTARADLGDDYR